MKTFFPLVLAALLGTASCGNMCFEKAKALCLLQVMAKHSNDFICGEIKNTRNATCTEGTELNTLFKKYGECSFQGADDGNTLCMNPIKEELKKADFEIKTLEEDLFRAACKHQDSLNECIDRNIYSVCGEEAMRLRQRLVNSSNILTMHVCEDLQYNASFRIPQNYILVMILLILLKWSVIK
ncbi:hypothetical protein CEXT_455221 [Caerostris extrusa]|uniref:Uncharacterized protein n=1 Tax=Caerostris extrusa TaxID=172846 RepID=A0AAV4P8T1_CAEEX|nr:hypothetical protein CEXT_455221 [Caerostris extrusa]